MYLAVAAVAVAVAAAAAAATAARARSTRASLPWGSRGEAVVRPHVDVKVQSQASRLTQLMDALRKCSGSPI